MEQGSRASSKDVKTMPAVLLDYSVLIPLGKQLLVTSLLVEY